MSQNCSVCSKHTGLVSAVLSVGAVRKERHTGGRVGPSDPGLMLLVPCDRQSSFKNMHKLWILTNFTAKQEHMRNAH